MRDCELCRVQNINICLLAIFGAVLNSGQPKMICGYNYAVHIVDQSRCCGHPNMHAAISCLSPRRGKFFLSDQTRNLYCLEVMVWAGESFWSSDCTQDQIVNILSNASSILYARLSSPVSRKRKIIMLCWHPFVSTCYFSCCLACLFTVTKLCV